MFGRDKFGGDSCKAVDSFCCKKGMVRGKAQYKAFYKAASGEDFSFLTPVFLHLSSNGCAWLALIFFKMVWRSGHWRVSIHWAHFDDVLGLISFGSQLGQSQGADSAIQKRATFFIIYFVKYLFYFQKWGEVLVGLSCPMYQIWVLVWIPFLDQIYF